MLYDSRFIEGIPPAQSGERRPLVNLKAHSGWLLEVLGKWYDELLPSGDQDLFARLREINDSTNFMSAFWELIILRFLRELGHDVRYNVSLNGKKPDLYWPNLELIGDIVAISDPNYAQSQQAHIDSLTRFIDRASLPFDLSIVHFSFSERLNPNIGRIVAWLKGLSSLSSEELYGFEHQYRAEDARLEVLISQRTTGNIVKAVGMFPLDSEQLRKVIKGRLRDKVKKYKRPIVVFVCAGLGFWPVDEDSLHMSLYGDWLIHFSRVPGREAHGPDTAANGIYHNRMGSGGSCSNTELSAVILAKWQSRGDKVFLRLKAYHNPNAVRPLEKRLLSPMPQFTISRDSGQECALEWIDSENEEFILGDPLPSICTEG